jgi:hypothetical protein
MPQDVAVRQLVVERPTIGNSGMSRKRWLGIALLFGMAAINLWALVIRGHLCTVEGPRPRPITWEDDSFYSLSIAYNIYSTGVSTVDGTNPTNGFQPLYVWALAWLPKASIGTGVDRLSFVDWAIAFQFVVAIGLGIGIAMLTTLLMPADEARIGKRAVAIAFAFTMCFASITTLSYDGNGLETRLSSLLLILFTYAYFRSRDLIRVWPNVVLGLLAGLLVYARLDMVLFLLSFGASSMVVSHRGRKLELRTWCVVGVVASIVLAPYLWKNLSDFGSIVPISGKANVLLGQRTTSSSTMIVALIKWLIQCPTFFYFPGDPRYSSAAKLIFASIFTGIGVGSIWLGKAARKRALKNDTPSPSAVRESAQILILTCIIWASLLVVYYGFIQRAGNYGRYMEPLRVLVVASLSILLGRMFVQGRRRIQYGGIAALLVAQAGALYFHASFFTRPTAEKDHFIEFGDVLARHGLQTKSIAVYQSGYLGYWYPHVTNLDGKVNVDALNAQERGDVGSYVLRQGFFLVSDPAAYEVTNSGAPGRCDLPALDFCDLLNNDKVMAAYEVKPLAGVHRTWRTLVLRAGDQERSAKPMLD